MVDVDSAETYKDREEDNSHCEFPCESESEICKQIYNGSDRFNYHVAGRYPGLAEAAFSAQDKPAEDRKHIKPLQSVSAAETVGWLSNKGLLERRPQDDDV